MGKHDNFVVDTRNLCFLCYRPAKIITTTGAKGREKDKTFSLRCISRFMHVDFQNMLKTGAKTVQEEKEGKFPQVLVTVCSRCSIVTEEFATLYQYMEFTQMKINSCIQNINELIKKTNGNGRLVDNFRKKMKTSKAFGGADVVENTRKAIMEECSFTLSSAFPRVKVRRNFGIGIDNSSSSSSTSMKLKINNNDSKPSPRSKKPEFSSTILKTDLPAKTKPPFGNDDKGSGNQPSPEKNEKGQLFQCLHCDNTFSDTGGLRVHIVRYHREQFFMAFKTPSISDDDFKVAVELLFEDVRKITANCGGQSTVSYVCTCCGKPFSAKIDTYVHMVQLHYDVLSTKLQSLQKNTSMLATAKKTIRLPDPSNIPKRGKRGPYKKKNKIDDGKINEIINDVSATNKKRKDKSNTETLLKKLKSFPRTCECGVQLSSRSSWNNHQKLHCKLKDGKSHKSLKPLVTSVVQHSVLKRAKNAVGFPRTCACGVRLSLRTSWNNHQRLHCKLKFGTSNAEPVVQNILSDPALDRSAKMGAKKRGKGVQPVAIGLKKARNKKKLLGKYTCECGSVLKSYASWYSHKRKTCEYRDVEGPLVSDMLEIDLIEEVPIDITPTGDFCLPGTTTSIEETSPVPKITKVISKGGVIQGLHKMASFQSGLKKDTVAATVVKKERTWYPELFIKYLPIGTSQDEIDAPLKKVLDDYKKFPGNISGCPFCGRGFSQVAELQNHMVEAHFQDVLFKLKSLIDPSGTATYNEAGVINVDPNLVKRENDMEITVPVTNLDLLVPGVSCLEEHELGKLIPKEEPVSYSTDDPPSNDNNDPLLILP